jgi:hypothetical protein
MSATERLAEIMVCHMRTGRGGRKRSGSRALSIGVGVKSKLTFVQGQLPQPHQQVDFVRDQSTPTSILRLIASTRDLRTYSLQVRPQRKSR